MERIGAGGAGPGGAGPGGAARAGTDSTPGAIGFWAVARETWRRFRERNEVLTGAGVAFFAVLSIVPALAALVAFYGLFADPREIADEVADLVGADAGPGRQWVVDELQRLTTSSAASLGLAAVVAIVIALWSASSGVRHLLDAVDGAVGRARPGWVRARARGLLGVVALVVAAAVVVAIMGLASGAPGWIGWLRFPIAFLVVLLGCAALYRRAGARGATPPGAVVAAVLWAASSVGLTLYLAWGPDLEAAYGALASVVAVMLWLWFSAMALLAGAHVTAVFDGTVVDGTVVDGTVAGGVAEGSTDSVRSAADGADR